MKVLIALAWLVLVTACNAKVGDDGPELADDLRAAFPDRITAVSFDTDDNILFIDVVAMDPEVERRFLCDEIKPKMRASGGEIDASTSYGWRLQDCP